MIGWGCDEEVVLGAFWAIRNTVFEGHNMIVRNSDNDNDIQYRSCTTCKAAFRSKKLPTIALVHGLHFPEKVECVDRLSRLEERLVAPRHIFQSLWTHKGLHRQYRSKGAVVNVPVTVDTSVSLLPRNLDDTSIIHVHLARKSSFIKNYMQGVVRPANVWAAVRYLQSTPLYIAEDIDIADEEEWTRNNMPESGNDDEAESGNDEEEVVTSNSERVEELIVDGFDFDDDDQVDADQQSEDESESGDERGDEDDEQEEEEAEEDGTDLNAGVQETLLVDNNEVLRIAPAEGNTPLSIIMDQDCDFLAFPKVFFGHKLETAPNVTYQSMVKS